MDVTYEEEEKKSRLTHWDSEVIKCLELVSNGMGGDFLPPGWTRTTWNVRNARIEAKRASVYEVTRKQNTMIRKLFIIKKGNICS